MQYRNRRLQARRPFYDAFLLFCLPTFFNLSSILGERFSRFMLTGLLIGLIVPRLLWSATASPGASRAISLKLGGFVWPRGVLQPALLLILLIAVSMGRGVFTGTAGLFTFLGFAVLAIAVLLIGFAVFSMNESRRDRLFLMKALSLGFAAYIAANIAGHLAGLAGRVELDVSNSGGNKLLSLIGISYGRVAMPFTDGLNAFGIVAGLAALLAWACVKASAGRSERCLHGACALLALGAAVLVDSRAVILMVCVAAVLAPLILRYRALGMVAILGAALLPVVAPPLVQAVEQTGALSFMKREGRLANQLGVASGRDVIWRSATNVLGQGDPRQIVGYGSYGHVVSGASRDYAWIFADQGVSARTVHNASLQYVLDVGYVGLLVWAWFWLRALHGAGNLKAERRAIGWPLVFLLLMGATEVVGTAYLNDSFLLMLFFAAALTAIQVKAPQRQSVPVRRKAVAPGRQLVPATDTLPMPL